MILYQKEVPHIKKVNSQSKKEAFLIQKVYVFKKTFQIFVYNLMDFFNEDNIYNFKKNPSLKPINN